MADRCCNGVHASPAIRTLAAHGPITDPGPYAPMLAGLPSDPAELSKVIQGLIVHIFWAKRYGLDLDETRQQEVNLRWVARQLERIKQLNPSPLTVARPLESRLVGNCRDFSVLTTAALRHQGIPARARCGFATYFRPGSYEDHWVVERYDSAAGRWRMFDPQLDEFQLEALRIDFDPTDMPPGRFLTGGEVWQGCRGGEINPEQCGIFDMRGTWFVQANAVRDFLAVQGVEILPWDPWGLMSAPGRETAPGELALLDRVASLTRCPDTNWSELQAILRSEPTLAERPDWWQTGVPAGASGALGV